VLSNGEANEGVALESACAAGRLAVLRSRFGGELRLVWLR